MTVRASSQGVVQCVELQKVSLGLSFTLVHRSHTYQKSILTMSANYSTHTGHRWHWRRHWTRSQIDDALAIWSGARNSLRRAFADQKTVARTPNIFLSRGRVSDWLHNLQFITKLIRNNKVLLTVASLHWAHFTTCCSLFPEMSTIAWQTRHVTIGTPPSGAW